MIVQEEQPAKTSYFFEKGYVDLLNTIKGAWKRNFIEAARQWEIAKDIGLFSIRGGIHTVAAISIYAFGSAITFATTAIHVGILALVFCLIYIGFGIVWFIDRVYIYINKIKNACPNSSCQASFLIPIYECPSCNVMHTKLVPSKYGILKRTCNCGTELPTTFLNGRGSLKAYCPECECSLSGDTASRQYAIPIIGGPSVGKTCLINMAVDQLLTNVAPAQNWDLHFMSENDEKDYQKAMGSLNKGVRLLKTEFDALTAYQLMLKLPNDKVGRRTYIYDISGEMFSSSGDVQRNKAYSYADGFIFVIDPLTIGRYAAEVEDCINIDSYGVSTKDFDDILNIMLINLEKIFDLKPKDVLKRNLAVVINKCDIPGLEERIGDTAAQHYLSQNPSCKDLYQAKNAVCKDFLNEFEAGNFVRTAESKFKQVQYFTCSALGHNKEGVPYEGKNVEEPFVWLLQQIDEDIKVAV
ncbi:MAG: GTPase domain-containing protein [Fermentimonas sp.]|jgi:GTPase SAR1 family protein|nr:GTPase domain-containing protein [Fermentimonas sp.]